MDLTNEINSDLNKKEKIAELLDKRNKDRQNNLNLKHEEIRKNAAENEGHETFQKTFRELVKNIEQSLNALKPADASILAEQIHEVATAIQNLQNYLSSSTLFLSNYNVKTCQETLNSLNTKFEETKQKLLGKKKFGFRSKGNLISNVEQHTRQEDAKKTQVATSEPINLVEWTLEHKSNVEILLKRDEVNDQDITLSTFTNCIVRIEGHPASLQLSQFTNCIVLCGPVSRSVFADNCIDCKLLFGCQQSRFHSSMNCDLYMHVTSRAIIEDCSGIKVAPYNYQYAELDKDFKAAQLDLTRNNWSDLADFNFLSADVHSPNWSVISSEEIISDWCIYVENFREINNIT